MLVVIHIILYYLQCLIKALDEWYLGTIDARHDTPIPYTTLFLTSFDVHYEITNEAAGEKETIKEKGVKSDRLRILAAPDGTVPGFESADGTALTGAGAGAAAVTAAPAVVINENTGELQSIFFLFCMWCVC